MLVRHSCFGTGQPRRKASSPSGHRTFTLLPAQLTPLQLHPLETNLKSTPQTSPHPPGSNRPLTGTEGAGGGLQPELQSVGGVDTDGGAGGGATVEGKVDAGVDWLQGRAQRQETGGRAQEVHQPACRAPMHMLVRFG